MSPPSHPTIWRRSAYGLLPFCSLARIPPTFCSVASLPIESRPCFPRMASQRSGPISPSSVEVRGLLLVAAHVAHGRQLWTTCRRRCTSELCSSRLRRADPSTHETRAKILAVSCAVSIRSFIFFFHFKFCAPCKL